MIIAFNECSNNTKTGNSKVLVGLLLDRGVEEGIQEQGDLCFDEEVSCLLVEGECLEKAEDVADAVGEVVGEVRWR